MKDALQREQAVSPRSHFTDAHFIRRSVFDPKRRLTCQTVEQTLANEPLRGFSKTASLLWLIKKTQSVIS